VRPGADVGSVHQTCFEQVGGQHVINLARVLGRIRDLLPLGLGNGAKPCALFLGPVVHRYLGIGHRFRDSGLVAFSQRCDLHLCPVANRLLERLLDQCEMLAGRIAPVTLCLVLSAAAQAAQTKEVVLAFGRQQLAGAIITKMDEATSLGGVLEALVRTELPALLTCDGQRVPDDIEPAKAGELVRVAMALTDARSRRSTLPGAVAG